MPKISVQGQVGKAGSLRWLLDFRGQPKKFRLIKINAPILIGGHLSSPTFGINAGPALVQGGIGAVLSTVATPLLALPFLNLHGPGDANCQALLSQASAEGAWASSSTPTATLTNGSGAADDSLGWAVAISQDGATALLGADGVNDYTGAAYIFHAEAIARQAARVQLHAEGRALAAFHQHAAHTGNLRELLRQNGVRQIIHRRHGQRVG